jgi:four helix bundle protein
MPITHFQDLTVWQEAKKLIILTYEYTNRFPSAEQYALTSQMRRAAISVSSNIAEGFGRKTARDKEHFYVMAYGSLAELENQILISKELNYGDQNKVPELLHQIKSEGQLINGLLRAHRSKS